MAITNCHIHTFTCKHTPRRFVPWPVNELVRIRVVRGALISLAKRIDSERRTRFGRYAQIIETSYNRSQADIFEIVRGFYPQDTRFVLLPMDMELMGAGAVEESIDVQHAQIKDLCDARRDVVIPFAAVDPRHDGVVEKTIQLLEAQGFRGIKLYPPTGYHPNDPALRPLYSYAAEHDIPVMTHCSRPASVQYRGEPTERMRTDPLTGKPLALGRKELLSYFTDPDSYVPILEAYPALRICLAHFGGAGDWSAYLNHPWHADGEGDRARMSWLAKILDLIRDGKHPNLWTDISYTLFADDEYVYLLRVLLSDERVRSRVLFGSDFYVVENAELEERRRAIRVRAVLGEEIFRTIAEVNPKKYLGEA
jgi:predicted TIM-barrel fold metal-dependent hydrolase